MSPAMWRRFLRPGFEAFIELGKRYGYKVAHHSCGSIKPIIPDLIECGLDILNPLQPEARDMACPELKRLFGHRLSFHGSLSIQRTLPFGTPEQIRDEVRERFEALGPGGGFIFCTAHNIQADTPPENVLAAFDAALRYGEYPVSSQNEGGEDSSRRGISADSMDYVSYIRSLELPSRRKRMDINENRACG